uniref:Transcription antitermination protein NusB n=1 Tax=candidate division WOR-3 bacterium TaxID=2052148 RepID=A0A7C6AGP3_UNCW3
MVEMSRRLARELALKMLYCYESGRNEIPVLINEILGKKKYLDSDKNFATALTMLTIENTSKIDDYIKGALQNWEFERIGTIDKLILRMGICEFLFFDDVPIEVSINEAIELAKKFGADESNKFVNGILDAIAKKIKTNKNESSNNK